MTIAATLDLSAAARRSWDVAVVGAGPAGALAARELTRRGCSVLLIDRASFPRWKVCGCCLNGHALALLQEVGLGAMLTHSGAVPLTAIRLASAGCSTSVPLSGGVVLSRESFDAALIHAAIVEGTDFLPLTLASLDRNADCSERRGLELQQGASRERVTARVVLAADGLGGHLTARTGVGAVSVSSNVRIGAGVVVASAPAFYESGRIFMACGREGYMGMVRLEDGRLNLAAALNPRWVRVCGGPGRAADQLLSEAGWPALANLSEQPWRGTTALMRQARQRGDKRLLLLGDAAGYIEPFTGEGMAWALATAQAVAPLAVRGVREWHPNLVRQWDALYRRLLGRRQRICRAVAAVLRSPWLMRRVVRLLTLAPSFAIPLTRYLGERKVRSSAGAVLSFTSLTH